MWACRSRQGCIDVLNLPLLLNLQPEIMRAFEAVKKQTQIHEQAWWLTAFQELCSNFLQMKIDFL